MLPASTSVRCLRFLTATLFLLSAFAPALAQRHDLGSAPPTAPPPKQVIKPTVTVPDPIFSGLGPMQFSTTNSGVSAPQDLAVQMQSSDDRLRTSALAAIGAPSQYLSRSHSAFPHSVRLDFIALGNTAELDAILTVELDQHLISAILMPVDDEWHHVASVVYPTSFSNTATTPATFLHTDRSLLAPQHYTAVFHATADGSNGDFTESEAHLRILNGHAVIIASFASTERSCDPTHQHPCDLIERWFQPDTTDPGHRFLLVTAAGHVKPNEVGDPIARSQTFETAHLRAFTCQPFTFSDTTLHFESTAPSAACLTPHDTPHDAPHDAPHEPQHDTPHIPTPATPPAPSSPTN